MIYLETIAEQTIIFFYSLGLGFLLGIAYDIVRIIKLSISQKKKTVFLQDIIYAVFVALTTLLFLLATTNGELRFYALFGELIGFLVYYFAFGLIVVKVSRKIIRKINSITLGVARFFKKVFKKIRIKIKFCAVKKTQKQNN